MEQAKCKQILYLHSKLAGYPLHPFKDRWRKPCGPAN